jgi:hypothetical protein
VSGNLGNKVEDIEEDISPVKFQDAYDFINDKVLMNILFEEPKL